MNKLINMENFAAQVCGMAPTAPTAPDLSGLEDFEYTTANGLTLRCYLEYEGADNVGNEYPSTKAKADLVFAFAGPLNMFEFDVYELIEQIPYMKAQIEAEYLADLRRQDAEEIANFNLDQGQKLAEDRAWERTKVFA